MDANTLLMIGGSAGSLKTIRDILCDVKLENLTTVIIVHLPPDKDFSLADSLNEASDIKVIEALDKAPIISGQCYVAPGGYHLYIEPDKRFSLSMDEKINHSRPSIDVTFVSGADVFQHYCIAVLLSGANSDGSHGIKRVKELGGITLAQAPSDSEVPTMPEAAIATGSIDYIENSDGLIKKLNLLSERR